jgi:hypothetical protein
MIFEKNKCSTFDERLLGFPAHCRAKHARSIAMLVNK